MARENSQSVPKGRVTLDVLERWAGLVVTYTEPIPLFTSALFRTGCALWPGVQNN